MATITSAQTGYWSSTTTWTGGVIPTSNDYVVINTNHSVTFNYDYSSLKSGLARVSVGGTLACTTSSGTYTLRVNGPIDGTGTFSAGSSLLNPLPLTTTFVIDLNTNNNTTATIRSPATTQVFNVQLFCGIPTNIVTKCIANLASSATSLTLDRDVNLTSNDRFTWSTNGRIAIVNINKTRNVEYRTITNIVGRTITFTPGLSSSKEAGAYVLPAKRNIQIRQYLNNGATTPTFLRILGGSNIGCELIMPRIAANNGLMLQDSSNITFNGASLFYTFSGGVHTLAQVTQNLRLYKTITTGTYNTFVNYQAGLFLDESVVTDNRSVIFGTGGFIRRSYLIGNGLMCADQVTGMINFTDCVFEGNNTLMRAGTLQQYNNCIFRRNAYTLGETSYAGYSYGVNGFDFKACTFTSNNIDVVLAASGRSYAYNTQFLSPSTVIPTAPTVPLRQSPPYGLLISYSNNGLDDNLRAWSWGGNITTDSTKNLKNDGKNNSYKWSLTDSNRYTFMEHYYRLNAKEKARWELHVQQSMTGMVEPLKAVLFENRSEPWLNSNDAVIKTWTIPETTGIHRVLFEYDNTGGDTRLILRLYARHGTGNIWHNITSFKQPYKQSQPGKDWVEMAGIFT